MLVVPYFLFSLCIGEFVSFDVQTFFHLRKDEKKIIRELQK